MLVLSRKPLESIVVGGANSIEQMLKVTVLEIKHGSVRLGFEAPAEIPVMRWELWKRMQGNELPGKSPEGFEGINV